MVPRDLDLDVLQGPQRERVPLAVDLEPAGVEVVHRAAGVLEDRAHGLDVRGQGAAGVLGLAVVDLAVRLQLDAVDAAALAGDFHAVGLVDLLEDVVAAGVVEQLRDLVGDELGDRDLLLTHESSLLLSCGATIKQAIQRVNEGTRTLSIRDHNPALYH